MIRTIATTVAIQTLTLDASAVMPIAVAETANYLMFVRGK